MLIEQPPLLYRALYPGVLWRIQTPEKAVCLTFDDGPVPEVTPWVLDVLDRYGIQATFFCVGDNVRKYPELYAEVLRRGHQTGNHTMHHIQGIHHTATEYVKDVVLASRYIRSDLFRPPHGHMLPKQVSILKNRYRIVMWDVVSRDYSKTRTPAEVVENIKRYARNGSVIVFHDSLKAERNLRSALPESIEWLQSEGYAFRLL